MTVKKACMSRIRLRHCISGGFWESDIDESGLDGTVAGFIESVVMQQESESGNLCAEIRDGGGDELLKMVVR